MFVVGNPPSGFGGRDVVFVKLVTDGGVAARARQTPTPSDATSSLRRSKDLAGHLLVGEDPHHIDRV